MINKYHEPRVLDSTARELVQAVRSVAAVGWMEKLDLPDPSDVNFYDYDGTIIYSYTKKDFLELTELPAYPQHEGLAAQGWNWTLEEAQRYVAAYGSCEIGQSYVTDDGKTRVYIDIAETERLSVKLTFTQSVGEGVTINWGDGQSETTPDATGDQTMTHTYAAAGKYLITLDVAEGCSVMLGTSTDAMTTDSMLSHQKSFVTSQYFGGRSPVTAIEIGEGVTALGTQAFLCLHRLEHITIPQNVTTFYYGVFMGCGLLRAVHVPYGVTSINGFAFRGCISLDIVTLPEGLTTAGMYTFFGCTNMQRVAIPEGVTDLGSTMFTACYVLERAVIPDSVASMGTNCFMNCYELREARIPASATGVPARAFMGCRVLTGIEIPEGVTTIGEAAFEGCFGMGTLTIPSTVTSIAMFAFMFCDGNDEVHIRATTPPTLVSATGFDSGTHKIYVPWSADHSVLAAYLAATNWCSQPLYEEDEPAWYGETVDVTVAKAWVNQDESTTWPEGVTVSVQLLGDSEAVGEAVTLDAENVSHMFEGLHKYSAENVEIVYSATEDAVAGYTGVVGAIADGVITITNTQEAAQEEPEGGEG